jgi:hypothetical protein
MLKSFLKKQISNHRELLLREGLRMNGFMRLLMMCANSEVSMTKEEKHQLKGQLKHLSCYVPILMIFLLPFGSLILPILAEVLDRRQKGRKEQPG